MRPRRDGSSARTRAGAVIRISGRNSSLTPSNVETRAQTASLGGHDGLFFDGAHGMSIFQRP